jgi:osmotically-inducible protein OsmY
VKTSAKFVIAILFASAVLFAQQPRGAQPGRYDGQIEQQVAKLIDGKKQFANVRYGVEDAIVTLQGKVELHSERMSLENRVRKIKNVADVRSYIVLDPTPVPDEQLYGRLRNALQNANLSQLNVKVHEGSVVVSGELQSRREWSRAINLVWDTPGVKEAEFDVRVLAEQQ